MFDALVGSVFMMLVLLGTVAICYIIMLKLLLPKCKDDYYIIMPCNNNSSCVRKKAYGMRIKLNILGEDSHSKVIVLDNGISDCEKQDLLEICKECNGIYYVKNEFFKDYFDGRI